MAINHAGDLAAAGLKAERYTVALSDNTAATLCAIPDGEQPMGVVVLKFIGRSGSTIESYNVAMTSSAVAITPQISSNLSGTAELLVLWKK
jgi:hypothetical protein